MTEQTTGQKYDPFGAYPVEKGLAQWKPVLAIGAGTAIVLAAFPLLMPGLASAMSDTAVHAYWYVSRASAFVAFFLIWLSMLAGLGITSSLSRIWPGMTSSFELHRFTALLGIGFGLIHAFVLLGDQYINYNLAQLLVPFLGDNYRPEWVGFGQISLYLLLVVSFTFYIRDRLGAYMWRLIHMLSFALFLMVLIHGIQSGTDSGSFWGAAIYWISGVSVALASIYPVVAFRFAAAKPQPDTTGRVIAAGRAQPRPSQTGQAQPPAGKPDDKA